MDGKAVPCELRFFFLPLETRRTFIKGNRGGKEGRVRQLFGPKDGQDRLVRCISTFLTLSLTHSRLVSFEWYPRLDMYIADYLSKRGYYTSAQAVVREAGLGKDNKVPIDAPQGLLYE